MHAKPGHINILYTENITNENVHKRIKHAIGPYEDLLTTVKRNKLKWYDHVSRSSGVSKKILQGTVNAGRRGYERKPWEDNIKELTVRSIAKSLRASKDRKGWHEVIRKSVMVLLRPPKVM